MLPVKLAMDWNMIIIIFALTFVKEDPEFVSETILAYRYFVTSISPLLSNGVLAMFETYKLVLVHTCLGCFYLSSQG